MNKGFFEVVSQDIKRNKGNTRATLHQISFRIIQALYQKRFGRIGIPFAKLIHMILFDRYCIDIPFNTHIGGGIYIPHLQGIVVNQFATIGNNCTVFHHVTIGASDPSKAEAPHIGDNVFIGAGAIILGDISIGDNAVIGAGSVITHDVQVGEIVVGNNRRLNAKSR